MSLFMVFGISVCHVWSALLGCECLCVFCFSHHSLFNKAEVRYDVILQKVNIQSELKQHSSRVAANVPSLYIKNICIGSTSSVLSFSFFFLLYIATFMQARVFKTRVQGPTGGHKGLLETTKQLKGKINIIYKYITLLKLRCVLMILYLI